MDKQNFTPDYENSKKKKAWKELDSNMIIYILSASSLDRFDPAEEPSDSLLMNISKKLPAKVVSHLYFVMSNFDILIVQGLATAMLRMILLSTLTWKQILKLSPLFVPPRNSKIVNNTIFLKKLLVMEQEGKGYDKKEVDQITSLVPQWSYKVIGSRKQIKILQNVQSCFFSNFKVSFLELFLTSLLFFLLLLDSLSFFVFHFHQFFLGLYICEI